MEYKKHQSCILDSCCIFFSVETGAKIVGYIGVVSNSINIIIAVQIIALLAGYSTVTPVPNNTTIEWPITTVEPSINDDINVNSMNLADDINVNSTSPEVDLSNDVVNQITLLVFSLVINIFTLSSNILLLVGLYKRIVSYVKFGLTVGIVTVATGFALTVGVIVENPSLESMATLLNFVIPVYLLLVIRSAYYRMLEVDVIQPIYTFGEPLTKGAYHNI